MGNALPPLTLADFLAWDALQDGRFEFIRGEVTEMVGGRRVHGMLVLNMAAALKQALRGSNCRVFAESMQLQIGTSALLYPDVFVTCDPDDLRTERIFRAPRLVAEVLSDSTERRDRGVKFDGYRSLPSLQEYLLVDPDSRAVHLFRRGGDGRFTLFDFTGTARIELASLGLELDAAELFDGLEPPSGPGGAG